MSLNVINPMTEQQFTNLIKSGADSCLNSIMDACWAVSKAGFLPSYLNASESETSDVVGSFTANVNLRNDVDSELLIHIDLSGLSFSELSELGDALVSIGDDTTVIELKATYHQITDDYSACLHVSSLVFEKDGANYSTAFNTVADFLSLFYRKDDVVLFNTRVKNHLIGMFYNTINHGRSDAPAIALKYAIENNQVARSIEYNVTNCYDTERATFEAMIAQLPQYLLDSVEKETMTAWPSDPASWDGFKISV